MTGEKLQFTNEDLCARIQLGDKAACEVLIQQNEKFLIECANKITIQPAWGLDREDLIQEGRIALVRAAEIYSPATGKKFLSYAGKAVQNAMMDVVRVQESTFEGSAATAKTPHRLVSLDSLFFSETGEVKFEIGSYEHDPERIHLRREGFQELRNALDRLDARERDYLIWRYGFDEENRQRTRKETAKECNLTMGRAKKLEAQALDDAMLELPWWYYEDSFFPYHYIPY